MRWAAPVLLFVALLAACGYHLPGQGASLPPGVETVHVELMRNRTAEPFLENGLTDSIVSEFVRGSAFGVFSGAAGADAILAGEITAYETTPVSYDANDEITEYRSRLHASFALRRAADGKILWKGDLAWEEEYPASDDKAVQEDNEAAAVVVIEDRLAEELYFHVVDRF